MIALLLVGLGLFFTGAFVVAGLLLLRDYRNTPPLSEVSNETQSD